MSKQTDYKFVHLNKYGLRDEFITPQHIAMKQFTFRWYNKQCNTVEKIHTKSSKLSLMYITNHRNVDEKQIDEQTHELLCSIFALNQHCSHQ